jgi:hypothetical protein
MMVTINDGRHYYYLLLANCFTDFGLRTATDGARDSSRRRAGRGPQSAGHWPG